MAIKTLCCKTSQITLTVKTRSFSSSSLEFFSSSRHLDLVIISDLLVVKEVEEIIGEMLPLLVSDAVDKCIDFICCTASSRSLVSSADFCEVNLGGLGKLTRGGEVEPLSLMSSVGEDAEELQGTDKGDKLSRGGESSVDMSSFIVSEGRINLLGGGVGLPASFVG